MRKEIEMKPNSSLDKKALMQYLSALLLSGLNGIVASRIPLNSYEIVFLRLLTGGAFLLALFLLGKGKFHIKEYKKEVLFIVLSGAAMGASWMFLYEAYKQIGVSLSIYVGGNVFFYGCFKQKVKAYNGYGKCGYSACEQLFDRCRICGR